MRTSRPKITHRGGLSNGRTCVYISPRMWEAIVTLSDGSVERVARDTAPPTYVGEMVFFAQLGGFFRVMNVSGPERGFSAVVRARWDQRANRSSPLVTASSQL